MEEKKQTNQTPTTQQEQPPTGHARVDGKSEPVRIYESSENARSRREDSKSPLEQEATEEKEKKEIKEKEKPTKTEPVQNSGEKDEEEGEQEAIQCSLQVKTSGSFAFAPPTTTPSVNSLGPLAAAKVSSSRRPPYSAITKHPPTTIPTNVVPSLMALPVQAMPQQHVVVAAPMGQARLINGDIGK